MKTGSRQCGPRQAIVCQPLVQTQLAFLAPPQAVSLGPSIWMTVFSMHKPLRSQNLYHLPVLSAWIIFLVPFQTSSLFCQPLVHHPFHGAPPQCPEVTSPHTLDLWVLSPVPGSKLLLHKVLSTSSIHPSTNSPQHTSKVGAAMTLILQTWTCILKRAVHSLEVTQWLKMEQGLCPGHWAQPTLLTLVLSLAERRLHGFQVTDCTVPQNRGAHYVLVQKVLTKASEVPGD